MIDSYLKFKVNEKVDIWVIIFFLYYMYLLIIRFIDAWLRYIHDTNSKTSISRLTKIGYIKWIVFLSLVM